MSTATRPPAPLIANVHGLLMENVPEAPIPAVAGYRVTDRAEHERREILLMDHACLRRAPRVREYHILSLGAGVQSTTVYLLALDGTIPVHFDAAIFADTQEEPAAVYRHLEWLRCLGGPPILIRTVGRLGDDLLNGGAGIPAYTKAVGALGSATGKSHRQCTRDYKIRVIERVIRREVLGLAPRHRIPRGVIVYQYIGISVDEARRSVSIQARFAGRERQGVPRFPLLELGWTRYDCQRFLLARVPHPVERSACVFCPLKNDREWLRLKTADPAGWARAVAIDESLRNGVRSIGGFRERLYLHDSAQPLAIAPLRGEGQGEFPSFARECEGVCGN